MRRGSRGGSSRGAAGLSAYVVSCAISALLLVASGISYFVVKDVNGIGGSHAIPSGPSIGEQNILLMGLESRTDWNGNVLPWSILRNLHAGSWNGVKYHGVGGNATNTLILIHIPAGGKGAVGVSIPRDDLVSFADTVGPQQRGKIDEAYGVSMAFTQSQLVTEYPHMSKSQIAVQGNEAGRKAAIATVEQLTGVHIDHFAEVNLAGFYELASVLGKVEVCLNNPVPLDANSGFFAAKAGRQYLNPAMALAFVRQREGPTMFRGDLDRTRRQQAFIDAVVYQLRTGGVLGDLGKIQGLLSVARNYVITDAGWNLLDFATQARSLTGKSLTFHNAPITGQVTDPVYGAVNTVDVAQIQADVHTWFYTAPASGKAKGKTAAPAPAPTSTVDVLNGGLKYHLATDVSAVLVQAGYKAGQVASTSHRTTTAVEYGAGAAADAKRVAALFGVTAIASAQVPAGHIEVLLAASATVPQVPSASPSQSASASASSSSAVTNPDVTVGLGNGIPCVN